MLTVHHLGISQSERIVWLCEELGLSYRLVRHDRDPVTRLAPADYKALHPLGTAPIIEDGELRLAESGAIVEYVIQVHGEGRLTVAPGASNYADYLFWLHYANGSMMPAAMVAMVAGYIARENPDALKALTARLDTAWDLVEQRLGATPYLAGEELTAADIIMVFGLTTMRLFTPKDISGYPNILAYLQRIGERPAYQRAMAKAEPGMTPNLT